MRRFVCLWGGCFNTSQRRWDCIVRRQGGAPCLHCRQTEKGAMPALWADRHFFQPSSTATHPPQISPPHTF